MNTLPKTATKPYTTAIEKETISRLATEADLSYATTQIEATTDSLTTAVALKLTADGGTFIVPSTDPLVAGALWNDTGTLSISTGP